MIGWVASGRRDSLGPAVSVLIPVYNGGDYLRCALESLQSQSFTNFEIVVIDNNSTDNTPELLASWSKVESRLRRVRLNTRQVSAGLNYGARIALAPLIARLDSDDIAFPDRLAVQVEVMNRRPSISALGSAVQLIDANGQPVAVSPQPLSHHDIRRRQKTSCALVASSSMIRAEALRAIGGYREGLNLSEDFDLWLRLSEQYTLANLPNVLVGYRIRRGSVSERQPARLALASLCVVAAARARSNGLEEPFSSGSPNLRQALPILNLSRRRARRLVRYRSAAVRIHRWSFSACRARGIAAAIRWLIHQRTVRALHTRIVRLLFGTTAPRAF